MSGEKKHDYHLVDPSPWPIFTSITFDLALKSQVRLFTFVSNLTLTILLRTTFGGSLETCVVPPKPVNLQNAS